MGIRVNRRIKIAKGLSLNVSKSGISASAKVGRVTVNSRRGTTVNVANGVSVNVPAGKSAPRGKASARAVAPRGVAAIPAGPSYFRRPFNFPGWAFWTVGSITGVLLGAIPAVGAVLLLATFAALTVIWLRTPKQLAGAAPTVALVEPVATAPEATAAPTEN